MFRILEESKEEKWSTIINSIYKYIINNVYYDIEFDPSKINDKIIKITTIDFSINYN